MTSFADRENAIEAHYAILEFAAFKERLHDYKELGRRIAAHLKLSGDAAEEFAVELTECLMPNQTKQDVCTRVAVLLESRGVTLSSEAISRLAAIDPHAAQSTDTNRQRSWVEYLCTQLLMLFGSGSVPVSGAGEVVRGG